jgi:hypothetical protein
MGDGKKEIHRRPWKKQYYSSSRVFVKNYVRIYLSFGLLKVYCDCRASPRFRTLSIGGFHS